MTDHNATRRVQRQRERHARHMQETAAVSEYNRGGINGALKALGAGDAADWDQEDGDE